MLKHVMRSLVLTAGMSAAACAQNPTAGAAEQPPITGVPVKSVVLFSSGVGYFQHAGTVSGNGSTQLSFKTGQINDVLKSLVLQDLDGGTVGRVTYPSQDPIAKTLKSFQVDITENPPLGDLLNQLRGAKVTVTAQAEKVTGTILGVEKKQRPAGKDGNPIEMSVLNLLTDATIRSLELDSINSLALDDPQLQEELTKALAALAQARDQDKKPVVINFQGQGDRQVRIGYVVETPIWKTSYRLILGEKKSALQGWAIVENQTDSDWNGVQLSLVSGRPISFVMDLYQPLYVQRPVVEPELYASLKPPKYEEGMTGGVPEEVPAQTRAAGRAPASPRPYADMLRAQSLKGTESGLDAASSVESVASAAKVGELFQYTVADVTLARQKSAMLPIVTDEVETEKLSIYNAAVLPRNPLNGVRMKNTSDKHLLQGPITVLEDNSYAGDSRIDDLPPGQERLLSYGVDLQMLVDSTKNSHNNSILTGKIVKGVLEISRKHVASQDYLAENKSDKDKTLIVEHPLRSGWKLVDTDKPIETTPTLYRFKSAVGAGKSGKLTVKEEIVQSETIAVLPADIGQIQFYSRTGEIPQNVREALVKAIQLKQAMVDTERQINDRTQQINEIRREQNDIRENMKTADRQSQPYQRWLTKLNDQETQIEKLQTERTDLTKARDQQRKELEDYLANLSVG